MVLSDKAMLDLVRTLPIPVPWHREAFVEGIADMRGRPITLIATEPAVLANSMCGLWLAREDDDVILYERDATDFRIHHDVCHQIAHMVLGHHSDSRLQTCDERVQPTGRRTQPDRASELVNIVLGSKDYGDEQEHEADLFALLLMNATKRDEHSMTHRKPSRSTASRSQHWTRACAPWPDADDDLALVRGYARELKTACDDLHDEPFNPEARAHVIRLILQDSKSADAANERLHAGFARRQ